MDCASKLVECGYAASTAKVVTNRMIRSGIIPGKSVTAAQMCAALRAIPYSESHSAGKKLRLFEGRRALLSTLEEAQDVPVVAEPETSVGTGLCVLLGSKNAVRVRTAGDGPNQTFSLIDVARLVSGKKSSNALRDVNIAIDKCDGAKDSVFYYKFQGPGQRPTLVANLSTCLLVVLRLRSREAQRVSASALFSLCESLNADTTLSRGVVSSIMKSLRVQKLAVSGAALPRPLPAQHVWRTPAPRGIGDVDNKHYILGSLRFPDVCKTGHTTQTMEARLTSIKSEQPSNLGLYAAFIYHHEGALEDDVRRRLDAWGAYPPPAEYGFRGTEFRVVGIDVVCRAMDEVKKECMGYIESEEQVKRRRLSEEFENEYYAQRRQHALELLSVPHASASSRPLSDQKHATPEPSQTGQTPLFADGGSEKSEDSDEEKNEVTKG